MNLKGRYDRENQSRPALTGLFVIVALVASLMLSPLSAFAEGTAQITVGGADQVQAGYELIIPVNIQENPGIAGATFVLHYDGNALELTGISGAGGILGNSLLVNLEADSVGYLTFPANNTENGLLFSATFRVRDGAESGTYEIAVGLKDNLDKNLVNNDAQAVPATFIAGTVTIDGIPSNDTGDNQGGTTPTDDGNTSSGTPGDSAGISTPGHPVTDDGKEVTENIDVRESASTGTKQATVGTPFFVGAEEGSLNWDADMLDGSYDTNAGGYVLTPKKPGSTTLTYQGEEGNGNSVELNVGEAAAPLGNSGAQTPEEAGMALVVPLVVILAVAAVAFAAFMLWRRGKSSAPVGRHHVNRPSAKRS